MIERKQTYDRTSYLAPAPLPSAMANQKVHVPHPTSLLLFILPDVSVNWRKGGGGVLKPAKRTVSRNGYFFEGINILISTFCVCADGFQGLSKAFRYPIQLLTFYLLP
jgi:hypothetical protein